MIIVLKPGTQQEEIQKLTKQLEAKGVSVNPARYDCGGSPGGNKNLFSGGSSA